MSQWSKDVVVKIKLGALLALNQELADTQERLQQAENAHSHCWHDKQKKTTRDQVVNAVMAVREHLDLYQPAEKTREISAPPVTWQVFAEKLAEELGLEEPKA